MVKRINFYFAMVVILTTGIAFGYGDFMSKNNSAENMKSSVFVSEVPSDGIIEGFVLAYCNNCTDNQYSSSCKMMVQINGKSYNVSGYYVDKGYAKGKDNACENIRIAHVTGRIKDDKFISDQFTLMKSPN